MKPRTTFTVFIHCPDFGAFFIQLGNIAKSVNGSAKARAKPNMPTVGATQLLLVAASTRSSPTTGAVHEKLTSESVKAMRKMESRPVVFDALVSILFPHFDGRRSSNIPKKLSAKTTSNRKKKILNGAFVAISLSR